MKLNYNLSAYFIFPSLEIVMSKLEKANVLVDTYLYNKQLDPVDFSNSCSLRLRFSESPTQQEIELNNELESNEHHLFSYGFERDIIFVFKFPEQFIDDIKLIIDGKYSKVSDEYKELFFQMWEEEESKEFPTFYNQVFNKSEALKEHQEELYDINLDSSPEYFSKIDTEKETLL